MGYDRMFVAIDPGVEAEAEAEAQQGVQQREI